MKDPVSFKTTQAVPDADRVPAPHAAGGLGRWAREYGQDLHRFLTKRRFIESDIKDVCQEVYLRLLRFERTEVIQNPQAYLFRVAANVAHDFKLRQVQWTLTEPQLDEPTSEPGPEQLADREYRRQHIASVLAGLPPIPRAVIILQTQEDLTYDEIAVRLGVSRRVVKRAITRAYSLAREALAELV